MVRGLGFTVGFRVQDFGFRVQDFGFRAQEFGIRVQGLGFGGLGFGFWVQVGLEFRCLCLDQAFEFRVWDL
jgi:hypothetical protein